MALPVVRVRRLPPPGAALSWREGPDWPAAIAVLAVAGVGIALAGSALAQEAAAPLARGGVVAAAFALLAAGAAALVAAVGECVHAESIDVDEACVRLRRRTLRGTHAWREPLAAYPGLAARDRSRRLYVRNQDLPPSGRRGPVSEFVVVLRHASARDRDVELFRAQPSLGTLRAMHALGAAAGAGSARASTARASEERAREYRQALRSLARRLAKPVLVDDAAPGARSVDVDRLDDWLEPRDAPGAQRRLEA